MSAPLAPGVYVKEVPLTPSIAGVGTSTAAFIGVADVAADKMPANPAGGNYPLVAAGQPFLVTNWEQFKRQFGDFDAKNSVLAHSVYGFFNNGGSRCWVARVAQRGTKGADNAKAAVTAAKNTADAAKTTADDKAKAADDAAAADPGDATKQAAAATAAAAAADAADAAADAAAAAAAAARTVDDAEADVAVASRAAAAKAADATAVRDVLKKMEAIDEIAVVAVPGAVDTDIRTNLIDHCSGLKDRVAVLDGIRTTTITPAAIKGGVTNSDFAAIYFPWIEVSDPLSGGTTFVPPSGLMAGIYARVDRERGVHKAPANESVRGALGLEYAVSTNEQNGLNPQGINAIRLLNGTFRVWGARTMGGDLNEALGGIKYLNVRRLMNFLRESIDEGTQFAVFEPNSPPLWQRIIRSVGGFLTGVWRDGALFGSVPEEAFRVICDETTNPPDVRASGQVVTEVWVAPVNPAEFVIFRINQVNEIPA